MFLLFFLAKQDCFLCFCQKEFLLESLQRLVVGGIQGEVYFFPTNVFSVNYC